jgi:hypothetical protein
LGYALRANSNLLLCINQPTLYGGYTMIADTAE